MKQLKKCLPSSYGHTTRQAAPPPLSDGVLHAHTPRGTSVILLGRVVDLGRQAAQERVTGKLGVLAAHDITDHAASEGASVEEEGDGHRTSLPVVLAEGPIAGDGERPATEPQEVVGDGRPGHGRLARLQDLHLGTAVVRVVRLGKDGPHVSPVQLAVVDVDHRRHAHQAQALHEGQLALAAIELLLQDGDVGRDDEVGGHGADGAFEAEDKNRNGWQEGHARCAA
mmetsp:Transcript_28888/g.73252  ORF Transcript_28888/g.73252 Transcript_28888/m.73252 type:complete len:226 (+) Transcript_28888:212-889(+)